MRTLVIGDIHGCSQALRTLLNAVQPGPEDVLITLGDYVDRGPDSKGVIDLLLDLLLGAPYFQLIVRQVPPRPEQARALVDQFLKPSPERLP